jgi:hypothetical protein
VGRRETHTEQTRGTWCYEWLESGWGPRRGLVGKTVL